MDYDTFKAKAINQARAACKDSELGDSSQLQETIVKTAVWAFQEGQRHWAPIQKDSWIVAQDALEDLY